MTDIEKLKFILEKRPIEGVWKSPHIQDGGNYLTGIPYLQQFRPWESVDQAMMLIPKKNMRYMIITCKIDSHGNTYPECIINLSELKEFRVSKWNLARAIFECIFKALGGVE